MAKIKKMYVKNISEAFMDFIQGRAYTPVLPELAEGFELMYSFFYYTGISFDDSIKKFVGKTNNHMEREYLRQVNSQWKLYKILYLIRTNPKEYLLKKTKRTIIRMYFVTFALIICTAAAIHTDVLFNLLIILDLVFVVVNIFLYKKYTFIEKREVIIQFHENNKTKGEDR